MYTIVLLVILHVVHYGRPLCILNMYYIPFCKCGDYCNAIALIIDVAWSSATTEKQAKSNIDTPPQAQASVTFVSRISLPETLNATPIFLGPSHLGKETLFG